MPTIFGSISHVGVRESSCAKAILRAGGQVRDKPRFTSGWIARTGRDLGRLELAQARIDRGELPGKSTPEPSERYLCDGSTPGMR